MFRVTCYMNFMIPLPKQIKVIDKKDNWANFKIEALFPGYGITIGNALRRVLLSSLPGAAITQVKIKGISHDFSTIPGVTEDVISVLLNLKQLRFKMYGDDPQKAMLSVKGEKKVKGSDFDLPSQLELINKDTLIANLSDKKSELEIEILVERGSGYEPVEIRKKEKLEIGEIALDAIYTPVRKVSFEVENIRVEERTDFDSLKIEVETDGTITPEQAVFQASEILVKHFSLFIDNFKEKEATKETKEINKEQVSDLEEVDKIKLEDLKFSSRALNALLKNNIKTIGGILKKSERQLLELEGMGETSLKEIKKVLKKKNLELKP